MCVVCDCVTAPSINSYVYVCRAEERFDSMREDQTKKMELDQSKIKKLQVEYHSLQVAYKLKVGVSCKRLIFDERIT